MDRVPRGEARPRACTLEQARETDKSARRRDREREREIAILAQVCLPLLSGGAQGLPLGGTGCPPVLPLGGRSLERRLA